MARQRQEVKSTFPTPWKPEEAGDTIEGFYHGFNVVPDSRGKTFKSHKLLPEGKDEFIGISGALLDQKMVRIPRKTYVWVTYIGDLKTNNGLAKDFKVECEHGTKLLEEKLLEDSEDNINY